MTKRTNGEGTIYQTKDGLWRAEITLGYDSDNKRIKKTRSSKDLEVVQKWLNDERFKLARNIIIVSNDYTVSEWLDFWLENYKIHSVKSKTYDGYELNFRRYILPKIGTVKLNKVKGEMIQQIYNHMHRSGLSTSTIKNTHVPLSQAFEQAITNELIYTNPCKKVIIPKKEQRKARALTPEEQSRFVASCSDSTFHSFFVFALNTGMRCGEIMALTWNDVDTDKMRIIVNKTASLIVNRDEDAESKSKVIIDSTKTETSTREIPINNAALETLRGQKAKGNGVFVFSSKNGKMLMYRNINRSFHDLLSKLDISNGITLHSLRHSFATRLLEKGANIKVVSDLLGHASIQITLDIYTHLENRQDNSLKKLQEYTNATQSKISQQNNFSQNNTQKKA